MTTRRRSGAGGDPFSQLMLRIREQSEFRQVDAAERSGLAQPKISRVEQGKQWLSEQEAARYADALRATPEQRRELLALARTGRPRTYEGQARLWRRGPEIERHVRELEQTSALIRAWQPLLVPGMLQSPDYMMAVAEIPPGTAESAIAKWRRERSARVVLLDDPDRHVHLLISEGVLRWTVGSHLTMIAQIEHLLLLMERSNVRIGVVPFGPPAPPAPSGFYLYDDRTGEVDTLVGTTFLDTRRELDGMAGQFERLDVVAAHGDDARELLHAARVEHQRSDS